jgi:hypothetical protein
VSDTTPVPMNLPELLPALEQVITKRRSPKPDLERELTRVKIRGILYAMTYGRPDGE